MEITDISPEDQWARINAALGYSRKSREVIAGELGVHASTVRRRKTGAQSMDELYRIAEVCGVPKAFMKEGFARYDSEDPLAVQVRRIREDLSNLIERLVRARVLEAADTSSRQAPGKAPRVGPGDSA